MVEPFVADIRGPWKGEEEETLYMWSNDAFVGVAA